MESAIIVRLFLFCVPLGVLCLDDAVQSHRSEGTAAADPSTGVDSGNVTLLDALLRTMKEHSHIRRITVSRPMKYEHKTTCVWDVMYDELGAYGVTGGYVKMRPRNCSTYSDLDMSSAFPCQMDRSMVMTCKRPLPDGADAEMWEVHRHESPMFWQGPLPKDPEIGNCTYNPFTGNITLKNLYGLAVARSIRYTGTYTGAATLSASCTTEDAELHLYSTGFSSELTVYAGVQKHKSPKRVQWTAWVCEDKLIVDMTFTGRKGKNGNRMVVGYTVADLDATELNSTDNVEVDFDITSQGSEPRLCTLSSLTSACHILSNLTDSDVTTLGVATGFRVTQWGTRPVIHTDEHGKQSTYVYIEGYILGTEGVIFKEYSASILDTKEVAWLELPFETPFICSAKMYKVSDCANVPRGAPRLGLYKQYNDVHYSFRDLSTPN